jgi:hypothetical protein
MADAEERKADFERVSFLSNIDNPKCNTRKQYAYLKCLIIILIINPYRFIFSYSQLVFKSKQETVKLSM